jgi:molybdopterin/thiamine biosynthesis adenylyltransferase
MNIALVGAGGIGSWTSVMLAHLLTAKQVKSQHDSRAADADDVTVFDMDVVEKKNLRHQLFRSEEIGAAKSLLVAYRHGYHGEWRRFVKADIASFDCILLAVDNAATRLMVYKDAVPAGKRVIDMRAEGRTYAVFTHRCPMNTLMGSLGQDPASTQGFSCQRPEDVLVEETNLANFVVPGIGLQLLLDDLRGIPVPTHVMGVTNREVP